MFLCETKKTQVVAYNEPTWFSNIYEIKWDGINKEQGEIVRKVM